MSAPESFEIAAPCAKCGGTVADHRCTNCGRRSVENAAPRKVGRPRSAGPRTSTAMRLPDTLHERLLAAAVERDVSLNFLMVKAVEQFLDRLIPVDEMRWTRD